MLFLVVSTFSVMRPKLSVLTAVSRLSGVVSRLSTVLSGSSVSP